MKLIATDPESVIKRHVDDSLARCGQTGVSALYKGDSGDTILILRGHLFSGDGEFSSAIEMTVDRGVVVGTKARTSAS